MTAETVRAWWFEPQSGVLDYGDGRKPVAGTTHTIEGKPIPRENGFHGSLRLLDAMKRASSCVVWITEHGGEIDYGTEKLVSTERTYLQRIDLSEVLPAFARWAALQVAHLWSPSEVVLEFLMTGKEELREAARAEAEAAGWAEAAAAERAETWAAARATACAAEAAGWAAAAWAADAAAAASARAWAEAEAWAASEAGAWAWARAAAEAARAVTTEAQNTELERLALLAAGEGAFDER